MSFLKKGKSFPASADRVGYAIAIAEALRQELGGTNQAIKVLIRWTGANDRTVKNWLTGRNGPSGEHLIELIRHSDGTFKTMLRLTCRRQTLLAEELARAVDILSQLIELAKTVGESDR